MIILISNSLLTKKLLKKKKTYKYHSILGPKIYQVHLFLNNIVSQSIFHGILSLFSTQDKKISS